MTSEEKRLQAAREGKEPWKKWGPYLSERQWGTVREDYSDDGNSWKHFTHEQARYRAYRWGEDGLAGISDEKQRLCFALGLWNGQDSIIKERFFGLDNSEGNHGEDVKEYYFYLDNTPTHSYMKWLYKYPQAAFPYEDLVTTNAKRSRQEPEYELLDTGIFKEDRYFDVFVEYAKAAAEDLLIKITVHNRGPEEASLHLLPTLWFRNTWSWVDRPIKPSLTQVPGGDKISIIQAEHKEFGTFYLHANAAERLLFTENETNQQRYGNKPNTTPYVKDAFNEHLVHKAKGVVNPSDTGTKAACCYFFSLGPGESKEIRLRLAPSVMTYVHDPFGKSFDATFKMRQQEADEFYADIIPKDVKEDAAKVMRQSFAGLLWTKQYYYFDANRWLEEHGADPFAVTSKLARNKNWFHMVNDHVISMPDKWEYPWYASWDLAFHAIAFSPIDPDFAKDQLLLVLSEQYMHPNGQIPAYEWNFNDVNPPVHAWATIYIYRAEKFFTGEGDVEFLKRAFGKLLLNFTWWVNRKDLDGRNVFEGGFLGMDNIGVFDHSNNQLPGGGKLEQADGTAWMALFCQNLFEIAIELASIDPDLYEDFAIKFADHFFWIAAGINRPGMESLWDEKDGFYYDLLRINGQAPIPLKVRSMVGLLPFCATTYIERWKMDQLPRLVKHLEGLLMRFPEIASAIFPAGVKYANSRGINLSSVMTEDKLRRILKVILDEKEFLSPYGIRSLSRIHKEHPFVIKIADKEYGVGYLPGDSDSGMFGGNSNWRGPVWMPTNILLIRALLNMYVYFGDNFKIECPTGSGKQMNLFEAAHEIEKRLESIFIKDKDGRRPLYANQEKFQKDAQWNDYVLFYEYFHGDTGQGIGASHQTGWTGIVSLLIRTFTILNPTNTLTEGRKALYRRKNLGQAPETREGGTRLTTGSN